MSYSKLLDLPHLAVQKILNFMDLIDILDFSLTSKKAMNAVKLYQNKAIHCNLIFRRTFDKKVQIKIDFSDGRSLTWSFSHNPKMLLPCDTVSARNIGTLSFAQSGKIHAADTMIVVMSNTREYEFRAVTEHLLRIFPCQMNNVEVHPCLFLPAHSLADWYPVKSSKCLTIRAFDSSKEDLEALLTGHTHQRVEIVGYKGQELDAKLLRAKELKLDNDDVSVRTFCNLKAERIEIGDNRFSGKFLGNILHQWVNGRQKHMKTLEVTIGRVCCHAVKTDMIYAPIRQSIVARIQNGKEIHGQYFQYDATTLLNADYAVTIRNCNNKLGSLFIHNSLKLFFVVWDELFHQLTVPRGMYFNREEKAIIVANHFTPKTFLTTSEVLVQESQRVLLR